MTPLLLLLFSQQVNLTQIFFLKNCPVRKFQKQNFLFLISSKNKRKSSPNFVLASVICFWNFLTFKYKADNFYLSNGRTIERQSVGKQVLRRFLPSIFFSTNHNAGQFRTVLWMVVTFVQGQKFWCTGFPHCYFTRLNPKRISPF